MSHSHKPAREGRHIVITNVAQVERDHWDDDALYNIWRSSE